MNSIIKNICEDSLEEVVERPYSLRKMKDSDLYSVIEIVTKVFPDDLTKVFVDLATGEKSASEVGGIATVKLVVAILKNIGEVRESLYSFLSDVSGIPVSTIEEMEFGTTPMMIWDIANDVRNASFFKVVSKLF